MFSDRFTEAADRREWLLTPVTFTPPFTRGFRSLGGSRNDLLSLLAPLMGVPDWTYSWTTQRFLVAIYDGTVKLWDAGLVNPEGLLRLAIEEFDADEVVTIIEDFKWHTTPFETTVATYEDDIEAMVVDSLTPAVQTMLGVLRRAQRNAS